MECHNCKRLTEIHEDYSSGDSICTECGFVLEASIVDDRPEWRNFEGEELNSKTRAEWAPSTNHFSEQLHTQVAKTTRGGERGLEILQTNKRFHNIESDFYVEGFGVISDMVEKLQLVKTIEDHAKEIYKKVRDADFIRGRNDKVVTASCLYLACGLENNSRTLSEIAAASGDVQPCDISRMGKKINKKLGELGQETTYQGEVDVTTFARRFCSRLQLPNDEVRAVTETMRNLKSFDIRRKPNSVLAAVIFMVNQMSGEKRDLREIALATSVGEVTIASVYKYIRTFQSKVVPKWFLSSLPNATETGSSIATNQNKNGPVKTTFVQPIVNSPVGKFKSMSVPNSSFSNPNMGFQHNNLQNNIVSNRTMYPVPVPIPTVALPPQACRQERLPNTCPSPVYCDLSDPIISFSPVVIQNQIAPNVPVQTDFSKPRIDYPPDLRKKKVVRKKTGLNPNNMTPAQQWSALKNSMRFETSYTEQ